MPFSIDNEGMMCVSLKHDKGSDKINIRVEVRSGGKNSRCEVVFRLASFSSPYRFTFYISHIIVFCLNIIFSNYLVNFF